MPAKERVKKFGVGMGRARISRRACFETRPPGAPCISRSSRRRGRVGAAVADGSPHAPWADEPAAEHGAPSVGSLSPNSRRGRQASPHAQGRDMEHFVGIDVAKDRLDVHLRPSGEAFAVARDGEGLAAAGRAAAGAGSGSGRDGGDRRLRDGGGQRDGRRAAAAGGGQSPPDPRFCPRHRQAGQDRPARRRGDRSFCRSDPAAGAADRRCRGAGPRRTGGAPPPGHRDDGRRTQSPPHGHPAPGYQGDRAASRLCCRAELSELEGDIDGAIRSSPAWQADADLLGTASPASARRRCAP